MIRTLRQIEKRNRTKGVRAALFDDTGILEDEAEDEAPEASPTLGRQIMRTKPRLVARRPRRKGPAKKKSPPKKKK